jgi:hypothetical protein
MTTLICGNFVHSFYINLDTCKGLFKTQIVEEVDAERDRTSPEREKEDSLSSSA